MSQLLESTISRLKSEKNMEIAVIRAAESDIGKLEQIANSIAAHEYLVTATANPIITPCGNYTEMSLHVTASRKRAADLIQLLENKGITAERSEAFADDLLRRISMRIDDHNEAASGAFLQSWRLTAYGSLPITLYIREPFYPRKAVQQEVAA